MRKSLKRKLRSCPMCKPNKTGGGSRWTAKAAQSLRISEREMAEAVRHA